MNNVYLVSRDTDLINLIRKSLEPVGYSIVAIEEFRIFSIIPDRSRRIILLDLPLLDASELTDDLIQRDFILILSDRKGKEAVIEAMRKGIHAYLEKPIDPDELRIIIERNAGLPEKDLLMTAKGSKMKKVLKEIKGLSHDDLPVLIKGEEGIDRGYYARVLHSMSPRKDKVFLPLDISPKGENTRILQGLLNGDFKGTEGGSIFIDDISDLDKDQAILLERLSEKGFRIIVGTRHDIRASGLKTEGLLKSLLDREIKIPPLRERIEELPLIAEHLLDKMEKRFGMGKKRLSSAARSYIMKYHWPGNDREIEEVMRRAYLITEGGIIDKRDLFIGDISLCPLEDFLALRLRGLLKENSNLYPAVIGEVEKALIRIALQEAEGNQLKASRMLGINRNTLRSKIKEHGLNGLLTK